MSLQLHGWSMPGLTVHHQLPDFAQTHVHPVSDAIQPSQPLWSSSPPALIFPSIRVFSNESVLRIRWPQYWKFSFSISPSNEYSGLISFKIDLFDLLAVQGTLKSLLQHHNSKASIRQSRFDAGYGKLGAGALGWPRGMVWGRKWEGGSGWGTHVHPWWIHVDAW